MIRVASVDKNLHVGVTHPVLATLESNGECFHAFIKTKDNPEGVLCLNNELIASRIASGLGLIVPEYGVASIDENTVDNTWSSITSDSIGNCFFSRLIHPVVTLNERIMPYIENTDSFEKIILFDHLIYNADRNGCNLILSSKKREKVLYAIDHTHVFKNQAIWDAACLRRGMLEEDYYDNCIVERNVCYSLFGRRKAISLKSLLEVASEFESKINSSFIDEALSNLPSDWPIAEDSIEALREYLLYRAAHLRDMCRVIVRYKGWPNE